MSIGTLQNWFRNTLRCASRGRKSVLPSNQALLVDECEQRALLTVSATFTPALGTLAITMDNSSITTGSDHEVINLSTDFFGQQIALSNEAGDTLVIFGNSTFPVTSLTVTMVGANPLVPGLGPELNASPDAALKPAGFYNVSIPITVTGGGENDVIQGGDGNDTLNGGGANDTIDGRAGADSVSGDGGNDTITTDFGFPGTVDSLSALNGGAGTSDILQFNFTLGVVAIIPAGLSIENIIGTAGSDTIVVTGADEVNNIQGGLGNDLLIAGPNTPGFSATLVGGVGDDTLLGSTGADVLDGGLDRDSMSGGSSNDILFVDSRDFTVGGASPRFSGGSGVDSLRVDGTNYAPGDNKIEINDFAAIACEEFLGGDEIDRVIGTAATANLKLFGAGGDDELRGGSGKDTVDGGAGVDGLFGGDNDDLVRGGSGNDNVFGEGGNDELFGGDDDDVVDGGAGIDVLDGANFGDITNPFIDFLTGGIGDDLFITEIAHAADIVDFTPPGDKRKNRAGVFF